MKIILTRDVQVKLHAWAIATNNREFSGLGLVERVNGDLHVVHVDLLGVGSYGYTEFDVETQRALPIDERRKLWFHRHPILGWSGRDEQTCVREPLGGVPQLVRWSCAIVLTPKGWIGRVDFHVPQSKTIHCEVEPSLPAEDVLAEAAELAKQSELLAVVDALKTKFEQMQYGDLPEDDFDDFDPYVRAVYECGCEYGSIRESELWDECPQHGASLDSYEYADAPAPLVAEPREFPSFAKHSRQGQRDWRMSFSKFWKKVGK